MGLNGPDSEQVLDTLHTLGIAEGWRSIGRKMIRIDGVPAGHAEATPALLSDINFPALEVEVTRLPKPFVDVDTLALRGDIVV